MGKEPLYPHITPSQKTSRNCTTQVFANTLRTALNRDEFDKAVAVRIEIFKDGDLSLMPLDKTGMPFGVGKVIKSVYRTILPEGGE